MPDRPNGLQTDVDLLRAEFARLENQCRELTSVQDAFLRVSGALSATAGDEFFTSLVAHLSHSLAMECVCVAQVIDAPGERMRTTAMALQGRVVPNIEYDLRDTPCETIFGRELAYYAEGVCQLFPKDQFLVDMRAESYIGAPLFDSTGRPLGLVAAIDTKPLAHPRFVAAIFGMLAARVADELQRKQAENRLRESHEFQRQLIDNVHGLVAYDQDARYTLWNRFMQELSGLSQAEVVGRRPTELFPWAAEARVEEAIAAALSGSHGTLDNIRFEFPKAGRSGWSSVRYYPLRDGSGNIRGAIGSVVETTELRQAERALRESDERLRLAVSAGRVGCWDHDILANRTRTSADFGLPTIIASHSPITDFESFFACLHPDDREAVAAAVARSIRDRTPYEAEFRILSPDGTVRWLAEKGQVYSDAQGRAERMIGVTIDIHDRKQAEIALRESDERARLAFSAARMGAFDWKAGNRKSEFFGNMTALFGRAPDDEHAGYADFLQSIHPDDRTRVDDAVQRALQGGEDYNVEFRAVWPDGTLHWIAETGRVHRDPDGRPVRMVGIAMDIDERKRLEQDREQLDARVQQAQKLEMLGTLAGGVAHDFNNLLQAILSNSGLIREQAPASPATLNCLDQIDIATQRASELTRQLLAYAGKGRFVSEAVDLSQLALEMSRLLEASLPKRARIQGQFPPGLPAVEGDPTQVRQVVMNLVLNAAEALPNGSGTIRLATGLVHLSAAELSGLLLGGGLSAGKYLYFEVCDTGVGMSDDARVRIFDPFYTTKDKGRGLGLAAVLGIVRSHRGAIQVHSEPGEGTVFRVLFAASEQVLKSRMAAGVEPPVATPDRKTILVVDDESAIRNAAQLLLEAHGFRVVTAGNGLEALQIFRERHADFSAVLLDLTMPHMDGSKAFRELRAIRPGIPILVTSGYSAEEAELELKDDGPAGFIQKPYRAAQLRAKLQEVLQGRRPPP